MKSLSFQKIFTRRILRSPGRYLAILLISMVGVGFSAGVRATCPDMKNTCDAYLDASECADLWIVSGIGFTPDEIDKIRKLNGVAAVQGYYSFDALACPMTGSERSEKAVRILSIPTQWNSDAVDRPVLIEGRLPRTRGECLAETGNFLSEPAKVGDRVRFTTTQGKWTCTVVGIARSPLYISWERGSNRMGDGNTACYFLVDEYTSGEMYTPRIDWPEGFTTDSFYPEVHIALKDARKLDFFENEYDNLVGEMKEKIRNLEIELTGSEEYWYFLDRKANAGIRGFMADAERVGNVGKIFPAIFFLVAALVSLTSMTRLIDEERVQIGTLKALGYSDFSITSQYILYAATATFIGGIAGASLGFLILPKMIYSMYRLMYSIGPLQSPIRMSLAAQEILAALFCTTGAAAIAAYHDLLERPASLLRPKAPKPGRRVLLERAPFIWKRLDFLQKVTARNIFRYRKRFYMTLAGISGCTALLLTGFGLNDSLRALTHTQFGEIYHYDVTCVLYDGTVEETADFRLAQFESIEGIDTAGLNYIQGCSVSVESETERKLDATLVVPRSPSRLSTYVSLREGGRTISLPRSGVVLTRKASELLGVRNGDSVRISAGGKTVTLSVAAITEQYILHFIYMDPEEYTSVFGMPPLYNQIIAKTSDRSPSFESILGKRILDTGEVRTILFTSSANKIWDDTMGNMGAIVSILVVSAGILAFIVVYTLTSINITERKKELATIKVLGFRNEEIAQYVFRENAALTTIGVALGLLLGVFLHRWVVLTAEVDVCMFGRTIGCMSFLWAMILSIAFAFSVNLAMYPRITRIDMVSAMKSVDE